MSAVDAHVSLALFEECITGIMQDRTRVLVTHQVQYQPHADRIVVVDGGKIRFCGTWLDILPIMSLGITYSLPMGPNFGFLPQQTVEVLQFGRARDGVRGVADS